MKKRNEKAENKMKANDWKKTLIQKDETSDIQS